MEGNNKNSCDVCGSGYGSCGSCGNMCGFGRYSLLRWFLGILIITWVFSIGVKFGEIKAALDNAYGANNFRVMPMPATWSTSGSASSVLFSEATPAVTSGTIKVISQ